MSFRRGWLECPVGRELARKLVPIQLQRSIALRLNLPSHSLHLDIEEVQNMYCNHSNPEQKIGWEKYCCQIKGSFDMLHMSFFICSLFYKRDPFPLVCACRWILFGFKIFLLNAPLLSAMKRDPRWWDSFLDKEGHGFTLMGHYFTAIILFSWAGAVVQGRLERRHGVAGSSQRVDGKLIKLFVLICVKGLLIARIRH